MHPKLVHSTPKYCQFKLQIWPLTLTCDLDHSFNIRLLLRVPMYTYILNINFLRQILSGIAIFDDMFWLCSTYRPVEQKREVAAQVWHSVFKKGCSTAHFGICFVSLRQIVTFQWYREISSIFETYLTFDIDLWPWPEMWLWYISQCHI